MTEIVRKNTYEIENRIRVKDIFNRIENIKLYVGVENNGVECQISQMWWVKGRLDAGSGHSSHVSKLPKVNVLYKRTISDKINQGSVTNLSVYAITKRYVSKFRTVSEDLCQILVNANEAVVKFRNKIDLQML